MNLHRPKVFLLIVVFLLQFSAFKGYCAEYAGAKVTQLKKSTVASNGQKLEYLKTESPEVTVLIVEIPAGGETGWHTHPVPVYAYMLSGSLTVETDKGDRYDFKEGEVILETMNIPHNGRNPGSVPAKLVVFYTGEAGSPTTVRVEHE